MKMENNIESAESYIERVIVPLNESLEKFNQVMNSLLKTCEEIQKDIADKHLIDEKKLAKFLDEFPRTHE
jgi:hypothetical protein